MQFVHTFVKTRCESHEDVPFVREFRKLAGVTMRAQVRDVWSFLSIIASRCLSLPFAADVGLYRERSFEVLLKSSKLTPSPPLFSRRHHQDIVASDYWTPETLGAEPRENVDAAELVFRKDAYEVFHNQSALFLENIVNHLQEVTWVQPYLYPCPCPCPYPCSYPTLASDPAVAFLTP